MTRSKWFLHGDRTLEVRNLRVFTTFQIWIYEDERPVGLHSTMSLSEASHGLAAGTDTLGRAMESAVRDVQDGTFSLLPQPATVAV